MICNHCGLCCVDYSVIIINPEFICETIKEFHKLKENAFMHKKSGDPCPYLTWENGMSNCKIHNYPWYKFTTCYDFTQIEDNQNCICRIGEYIEKNKKGYYEMYCEYFKEGYLDPIQLNKKLRILY